MRTCPFPRYQTQTPSRDKVRDAPFWSRPLRSRHRLSGTFPLVSRSLLVFQPDRSREREENRLSDSRGRTVARNDSGSFVYAFPLGWLARVSAAPFRARFQSPSKETAARKRSVSSNDVVGLLPTSVETSRDEPALNCRKFVIVLHRLREQWFIF